MTDTIKSAVDIAIARADALAAADSAREAWVEADENVKHIVWLIGQRKYELGLDMDKQYDTPEFIELREQLKFAKEERKTLAAARDAADAAFQEINHEFLAAEADAKKAAIAAADGSYYVCMVGGRGIESAGTGDTITIGGRKAIIVGCGKPEHLSAEATDMGCGNGVVCRAYYRFAD